MRPPLLLGVVVLACLLTGCAASSPIVQSDTGVDSLQAANARLQASNQRLRDSLRFRRNVATGKYYRERRTLQDQLTRLTYEARLLRDGGMTVALLPVDSLFASPDSLHEEGLARLRTIATQLRQTYPDRTVRVEGHADDTPLGERFGERFDSNWALSGTRAATVTHQLVALTDLDARQFVAVGYGATRPRTSNDTAAGRQRNRRVRIAVLPRPRDYPRPFETSW